MNQIESKILELREITKWKARLCAGGHKSIEFVDYWNTYSPVVSWSTVRLLLVLALINNWHMQSIDFVLAFPQAPVKTDIYMLPPKVPSSFKILAIIIEFNFFRAVSFLASTPKPYNVSVG